MKFVAETIKQIHDRGVEIAIVVGGGNIWRGRLAQSIGVQRSQADYMGMLGTLINALAVQSSLEQIGIESRVMSAIDSKKVAEPYIRRRAIRHLEKGRVVIFGGGIGEPYFTTDTAAALRATDIQCDAILMAKNGVDGVYTDDPKTNPNAQFISSLTFKEMIEKNLKVMDQTAVSLCMDTPIEVRVFNMSETSNFIKILDGEEVGTTMKQGE